MLKKGRGYCDSQAQEQQSLHREPAPLGGRLAGYYQARVGKESWLLKLSFVIVLQFLYLLAIRLCSYYR